MLSKSILTNIFLLLSLANIAEAEAITLDLLGLGCPQEFPGTWTYWQSEFNLGVTFSEISHVYIDLSGEITAGLAQDYNPATFEPVGDPYPKKVGINIYLGSNPGIRSETLWGGELTYPDPEPFDSLMEIKLSYPTTWSDLLDGQGTITIGYEELFTSLHSSYIDHGNIVLNEEVLVVDGIVVPEPVSLLFFAIGLIEIRRYSRKRL